MTIRDCLLANYLSFLDIASAADYDKLKDLRHSSLYTKIVGLGANG